MAKRIGGAVLRYRQALGLTAVELSGRCDQLGMAIHRTKISKMETGERTRFDLGELLILAAALRVSPSDLLFPALPDGEVEILPGVMAASWDACQWVTGEGDKVAEAAGERLVGLCRAREGVLGEMRDALRMLCVESGPDGKALSAVLRAKLTAQSAELDRRLAVLDARITALGGVVAV